MTSSDYGQQNEGLAVESAPPAAEHQNVKNFKYDDEQQQMKGGNKKGGEAYL